MVLLSCSTVHIADETVYVDKDLLGAVILHTQTTDITDITKSQWDEIRPGMLCVTPDTFAESKKELEELCSLQKCSFDMKMTIDHILKYMNHIESMYNKGLGYQTHQSL